MGRPPANEARIKALDKELNLARGTILNHRARIDDLEKRLAAKTEYAATLLNSLQKADIELGESKRANEMIEALEAELAKEREINGGLIRSISDRDESNENLRQRAKMLDNAYLQVQSTNLILRQALKAVL
jgi:chromosome segregation ATPase